MFTVVKTRARRTGEQDPFFFRLDNVAAGAGDFNLSDCDGRLVAPSA
jgi:hypothetical protein